MTIKEQILQELDRLPEESLEKVLAFSRSLADSQPLEAGEEETWQAYLESEKEREEVYRRLANS
ncbi:hypothetical protein V0288_22960 [Pannus brasiliensis CCIBt3594]|uniref:DUF2281 domain-containing protein n=1 Tax=Pannus brasiliensis CCIBt3594 TaxID=1427578 RepID=A0AAW9QZ23_9CHRO